MKFVIDENKNNIDAVPLTQVKEIEVDGEKIKLYAPKESNVQHMNILGGENNVNNTNK